MVGGFFYLHRRRILKVNAGKRKVRVLGGKEGLEQEVCIDGIQLEHMLGFKYFGYGFCESRKIFIRRWQVEGVMQVLLGL